MGRGPHLTEYEESVIRAYHEDGLTPTEIADRLPVSRGVKRNAIASGTRPTERKIAGKPRKIAPITCRTILHAALRGNPTARQQRNACASDVSVRTVQRLLKSRGRLGWRKLRRAPKLFPHHHAQRVAWAREVVQMYPGTLRSIVWSDEQKFNLDGPDGLNYHWTDLQSDDEMISRRRNRCGGIMVFGFFYSTGRLKFVECEKMDPNYYLELLHGHVLPYMNK